MAWQTRAERDGDADAIRAVTEAAFRDAPHADGNEHLIVDALREAGALAVSLVAEEDGAVIGHAAASRVAIDGASDADWYGLGPVSVAPARQRAGVGSTLVRAALQTLRELEAAGCVLLGDPAYYGRFGFEAAAPLVLPDVPPAYFQAVAFRGRKPEGIVAYHAAFGA